MYKYKQERSIWSRVVNYPRYGKIGWKRWLPSLKLSLWVSSSTIIIICGTFLMLYTFIQVPKINPKATQQRIEYYYSDNKTLIGNGGVDRENVGLQDVSPDMQHAIIAAENASFYHDSGISFSGIVRAATVSLFSDSIQGGGSTITQQYVRNAYLNLDISYSRKIKEIIIALKITNKFSKNDILERYLNTIPFGYNAQGIQVASQRIFDVSAKDLNLAQSIYLASLVQRPSYFALHTDKTDNDLRNRWEYVRHQMYKDKFITKEQYDSVQFPKTHLNRLRNAKGSNPEMIDGINNVIKQTMGKQEGNKFLNRLNSHGGKVYTTLDLNYINYAKESAKSVILSRLSSTRDKDKGVHVGVATVKPNDGAIIGMYGGTNATDINNVSSVEPLATKQPGSVFKAFILGAAFEDGDHNWTPSSPLINGNDKQSFSIDGSAPFVVNNEDAKSYPQINIIQAADKSVNAVFLYLISKMGNKPVYDFATKAGISPKQMETSSKYPSFGLGTSLISPLDIASGYATLAAGGTYSKPYIVSHAVDTYAKKNFYNSKIVKTQACSKSTAAAINYTLQHVVKEGTGTNANISGRDVAGKTGTTDDDKTAWFAGYTPDIATAVMMYREAKDPNTGKITEMTLRDIAGKNGRVNGGDYSAKMWQAINSKYLLNKPVTHFDTYDDPNATPTDTFSPDMSSSDTSTDGFNVPTFPTMTNPFDTPTDTPTHHKTPTFIPTDTPTHHNTPTVPPTTPGF